MTESTEAKLHFLDYWRVVKLRLGLILLTFFLVMVTAGVYDIRLHHAPLPDSVTNGTPHLIMSHPPTATAIR